MSRWLPLESNPDVINKYMESIGVPQKWKCVDVYGLDDELLGMVPKPCAALLLLFPITDKYEAFKKEEEGKKKGEKVPESLIFIPQTVGNACGTVALVHALANNEHRISFDKTGVFSKFLEKVKTASPDKRGEVLEKDDALKKAHETSAEKGQTTAPDRDTKVNLHFVAIVNHKDTLYELDGRKSFPVGHGKTSEDGFLKDAAKVCQEYIKREPDNPQFTVIALSAA